MDNELSKIADDLAEQKDWHKYFINKNAELETEYSNLVWGEALKVGKGLRRVGYNTLRDFFDGDQWKYIPEGGKRMRVYNYCRNVVTNYTAFMTNEPIDIDVPSKDITNEVDVARAEAQEVLLKDILADNKFDMIFESSVQNGSLLGDSIILGPFYDEDADRIYLKAIKKPENVRLIWSDDQFSEIFGFIHHYFVSPERAYQLFPEAKAKGIVFSVQNIDTTASAGSTSTTGRGSESSGGLSQKQMVAILDCWTADKHMLIVGNQDLKYEDGYGFVPCVHVPNIIHPKNSGGISDIEDMLDAQVEYNERNADMGEIINENAFSWIFGKNIDIAEQRGGQLNIVDVGDEGEIIPDPRRPLPGMLENEISRRLSTIFQISGLNENIFGGSGIRAVTGRALSVLMQTVNNRIKGRQMRWTMALQTLFGNIFRLIEKYYPDGKKLINGNYKTDIFFPGTLLRNVTDEINKFNAKLQSQETTMKNLGVPSPADERKLMKKELSEEVLMIETSRNPGLQMQVKQMKEQALAQKVVGQSPQLNEDENSGDEAPMPGGGAASAVSRAGAVNMASQRGGATAPKTVSET